MSAPRLALLALALAAPASAARKQAPVIKTPAAPAVPVVPIAAPLPALSEAARIPQAPRLAQLPALESPQRTLTSMDDTLSRKPQDGRATLERAYDGAAQKPEAQAASPAAPAAAAADSGLSPAGRLPGSIKPKSYAVRLSLEPSAGTFTGRVKIKARAARPVNHVVLHALELDVRSARVGGRALAPSAIKVDREREIVILELPETAAKGELTIELEYSGRLNSQMRGPYQSKGLHEGAEEKYMFTHFEPTNERRMVPSFDEPALKAVYTLEVEAPAELKLISNMEPAKVVVSGGRQTATFPPSPKMSSYLLALYNARLALAASKRVAGVKVAIWTAPGQEGQAGFAMTIAEKSLRELNGYFGLPYDLPKLDLVAASDFASGAMENWGAVLFRDSALLVDPKLSSTRAKRRVGVVVAHEIVHQWFGNLVTMEWWDDLWLNEAFATWLSYKIVDKWIPEWKLWLEFEQSKKSPLAIDSLRSTRAIASNAVSAAEIQAMFDPLTYDKGGSILRMLESYIGERKFRDGIRLYMKRHKYGNTKAADLWRALEAASGQPVTRVAEAWLKTPGYPIVEAEKAGPRALKLSQRRFLSERGAAADGSLWAVPVVVKYKLKGEKTARQAKVILDSAALTLPLSGKGELEWAYANAGETGFYRVGLSADLLSGLLSAGAKALSPAEKVGLLGHLWAQAKNGERGLSSLLDALEAFKGDADRTVLEEVSGYLKAVEETFRFAPADRERLAAAARRLLGPHAKRLGLTPRKGEDDEAKLARAAVVGALSAVGSDARLDRALDAAVEKHLAAPEKTDPAFVTTVLVAGARRGNAARFEAYLSGMRAATTPERRDQFLRALAEFREPALARRALDLCLAEELRPQDAWKPLYFALSNPAVQAEAWSWLKANWGPFKDKVGPRGASQIIGSLSALQSERWRSEIERFFAEPGNAVPIAAKKLSQSLDAVDVALAFRAAQAEDLERWLSAR